MKLNFAILENNLKELVQNVRDIYEQSGVKFKIASIAILVLILLFVIILIASNGGSDKKAPKQAIPETKKNIRLEDLKRYKLFLNKKIIDSKDLEYYIVPEEIQISGDENPLKTSFYNSRLFTEDERRMQLEINKLSE